MRGLSRGGGSRIGLAVAALALGGTWLLSGCSQPADGAADPVSAAPGGQAPTADAAPGSTPAPAPTEPATPPTPILVAPAPAAPAALAAVESPANVSVAAPDRPFEAVGESSGDETARIQQRLLDLGFWTSAADGDYGHTTTQAVMAFQKYNGLETSGRVDDATAAALTAATARAHGSADAGTLVEVDKQRQLLFIIQAGYTIWAFNTSTGSGEAYTAVDKNTPGAELLSGDSQTPNGLHAVTRQRPEGWWAGDLGEIYRPKYFVGGVAVHGSNSIPNRPASHGCLRVSVPAMDFIWDANLIPMNTPVWVHGPNAPVS